MSRTAGPGRQAPPPPPATGVGGRGVTVVTSCSTLSGLGQVEPCWLHPSPVGQGGPLPGSGQLRPQQAPAGLALGRGVGCSPQGARRGPGWAGRFLLPWRVADSALGLQEAAEPEGRGQKGLLGAGRVRRLSYRGRGNLRVGEASRRLRKPGSAWGALTGGLTTGARMSGTLLSSAQPREGVLACPSHR